MYDLKLSHPQCSILRPCASLEHRPKQSRVKGARLTRYAAALSGLEDRHRLALMQSASARNMEVGNYG